MSFLPDGENSSQKALGQASPAFWRRLSSCWRKCSKPSSHGNLRTCSSCTVVTRVEIRDKGLWYKDRSLSLSFFDVEWSLLVVVTGGGHVGPVVEPFSEALEEKLPYKTPQTSPLSQSLDVKGMVPLKVVWKAPKELVWTWGNLGPRNDSPRSLPPTNTAHASVSLANSVSKHATFNTSPIIRPCRWFKHIFLLVA